MALGPFRRAATLETHLERLTSSIKPTPTILVTSCSLLRRARRTGCRELFLDLLFLRRPKEVSDYCRLLIPSTISSFSTRVTTPSTPRPLTSRGLDLTARPR